MERCFCRRKCVWKEREREQIWNRDKPSLENAAKLKLANDHVELELPFPQTGDGVILPLHQLQLVMELDQHQNASFVMQ